LVISRNPYLRITSVNLSIMSTSGIVTAALGATMYH
jgi:hypothetical protein